MVYLSDLRQIVVRLWRAMSINDQLNSRSGTNYGDSRSPGIIRFVRELLNPTLADNR
jgi:hypothetical protein